MKFFVDTADTQEIADLAETGLLDGVTTNPSFIHKADRNFIEVTRDICALGGYWAVGLIQARDAIRSRVLARARTSVGWARSCKGLRSPPSRRRCALSSS